MEVGLITKGAELRQRISNMTYVYHPLYARVHPSLCEDADLPLLLDQGWFVSRELMLAGKIPAREEKILVGMREEKILVDTADAAVDAMVAAEKKSDTRSKKKK